MEWPALAELARDVFPEDVIARAKELQSEIGTIGAYSHSQGVPFIRKNVARFIEGQSTIMLSQYTNPIPSRGGPPSPNQTKARKKLTLTIFFHLQSAMAIHPTRTTYS
jgi:hypothetical protein